MMSNNDNEEIPVIAWNDQAQRVEALKVQCNQVCSFSSDVII